MKSPWHLLAGLAILGRSVLAHPFDLPFKLTPEHHQFLEGRTTYMPITGAPGPNVYPRYEIRQLVSEYPNQFTLFALAMQQFQAQAQSSSTSYYQIAGIHGVPRQNWNNVGKCSSCNADGYCTHNSVLFPAWHRVYMALFEQEMISIVNNIVNTWPTSATVTTQAQMQAAAATFRIPYWDWAALPPSGQHVFPGVVSSTVININGPNGSEAIVNPLYQHNFQSSANLYYPPFTSWNNTIRYPTNDTASAVSNETSVIAAFDNIQGSLQDQVYQLMTTCTDYLHFSNDDAGSSSTQCSNSLELIHNTIHQTVGGPKTPTVKTGGDMTYLSLAAFDPAFWLHHANVDRLFALWQTLHNSSYGATQNAPTGTWTIAQGSSQNAQSNLTPFTKDTTGTFWNTNMVRNWSTTFFYTYPEFADSNGSPSAIASYVNGLYGPSATATAGSSKRTAIPEPVAQPEAIPTAAPVLSETRSLDSLLGGGKGPFQASNGSTYQYVANIKTPRNALGASYYVFVFDGTPSSESPLQWLFDPNLIGPIGVLSQANMVANEFLVSGSVPLTRRLQDAVKSGALADMTELSVGPYLKEKLTWRINGPDGTPVDPKTLKGFELSVWASTASPLATLFELPTWSPFFPIVEATKGKPGGLGGLLGLLSGLLTK